LWMARNARSQRKGSGQIAATRERCRERMIEAEARSAGRDLG